MCQLKLLLDKKNVKTYIFSQTVAATIAPHHLTTQCLHFREMQKIKGHRKTNTTCDLSPTNIVLSAHTQLDAYCSDRRKYGTKR